MSNFYYKAKEARNLVQISISNGGYYECMNEVSNQSKWRNIPIELWNRGFDNEMRKLTTVCPEYKNNVNLKHETE
jgi:hypothetical protein